MNSKHICNEGHSKPTNKVKQNYNTKYNKIPFNNTNQSFLNGLENMLRSILLRVHTISTIFKDSLEKFQCCQLGQDENCSSYSGSHLAQS